MRFPWDKNNERFQKIHKKLNKDFRFSINESPGRKNTVKIVYIESGELYSSHPADHAVKAIQSWINKKE